MDTVTHTDADAFFSVSELAALLKLNENKVSQLADSEADRVLLAGSEDRLMQLVCSEAAIDWQRQGLVSYSPNGTRHGLSMLDQGQVDACVVNWGTEKPCVDRHLSLLRTYKNHAQWIIVRCFSRNQGFVVRHHVTDKSPTGGAVDASAILENSYLRWAMRQDDSGTERLLADLSEKQNVSVDSLTVAGTYNNARSAVAAVNAGIADICCGTKCLAQEYGLDYVPVTNVALDLVLPKRKFCGNLVQKLLARIHTSQSNNNRNPLEGYTMNRSLELISLEQ